MNTRNGEVSDRLVELLQQLADEYNEEVYLFDSCEKLETIERLAHGSLESQTTKERKKQSICVIKPTMKETRIDSQ